VKAGARKAGDFTLAIKSREKEEFGSEFKTILNYIVTTDKEEKQLHSKCISITRVLCI
jgi:hypothetical protein